MQICLLQLFDYFPNHPGYDKRFSISNLLYLLAPVISEDC